MICFSSTGSDSSGGEGIDTRDITLTPASEGTVMYSFLRLVFTPVLKGYFGLRSEGAERIPERGPLLIAANHASYIDPFVLGATCPRPIHFMMLKKYWKKPLLGWVAGKAGAFPVDPGSANPSAIRESLSVLKGGGVLGIFPEGGISRDGIMKPGMSGVALLALRTGVPVVPAAILGSHKALRKGMVVPRPHRVLVRYASPLQFPKGPSRPEMESLSEVTERIMESIDRLSR